METRGHQDEGIVTNLSLLGASPLPILVDRGLKTMLAFGFKNSGDGILINIADKDGNAMGALADAPSGSEGKSRKPIDSGKNAVLDWREVVRSLRVMPGMTANLMDQAFESEIEKHMALQAFAVLSGEVDILESWQFRTWRHAEELGFPLSKSDRMPRAFEHPLLGGPLHNLLTFITPLIVQVFADEFSLIKLSTSLGLDPNDFINHRRPVLWDEPMFQGCGIHRYKDVLVRHRFVAFSLRGLGKNLFFDGRHRALYFDSNYYSRCPPTHLFHRIMGTIRAIRLNYYVILSLDPVNQLLPLLKRTRKLIGSGRLGDVKAVLGLEQDSLKVALKGFDQTRLRDLMNKVPKITAEDLLKVYEVLWNQIYGMQLAETLDLIGILESIGNLDILRRKWTPLKILETSAQARPLVDFTTRLVL